VGQLGRRGGQKEQSIGGKRLATRGVEPTVLLFILAAAIPQAWQLEQVKDGVRIERRDVPGSRYDELRVSTTSRRSLPELCEALWGKPGQRTQGDFKARVVLSEGPDERLVYEQVRVPFFTDRDYVMHSKLVWAAPSGRCEMAFDTVNDSRFPPRPDHVRTSIRGRWTLLPLPTGEISVSYVVFGDPGGNVPSFIARPAQREAAVRFLRRALARAESG
jgi:hypothetical protein